MRVRMDETSNRIELLNLRDAFSINLAILQKLGVWPPENSSKYQRLLYYGFAAFMFFFIFVGYTGSETVHMMLVMGDLEKVTESSFMLFSHLGQGVKMYYYYKNNSRIRNLLHRLSDPILQPKNHHQYLIMKKVLKGLRKYTVFFFSLTQCACVTLVGFPFVDTKRGSELELPITGWFPFPVDRSPNFEIAYFYQYLALSLNVAVIVSIDITATAFMGIISGQFEILGDSLHNIKQDALAKLKAESSGSIIDSGIFPELQEQMNKDLVSCVHHHRIIMEMAEEVNSAFGICLLSQFFVSVLVIGLTMFQMSIVPISSEFFSLLMYQFSITFEIATFCWFGNEVILSKVGVWPPESASRVQLILYYIFMVLMLVFIYLGYIVSQIVHMVLVAGDLEKMTEGSFMLFSHLSHAFKMYYFIRYNSRIKTVLRGLDDPIFQPRNKRQFLIMSRVLKGIRRSTISFMVFTQLACVTMAGFPLLDSNLHLPISGWFPFSVDESPNFEVAYAFQTVGLSWNVINIVSLDTTATALMGIISGQFQILSDSLQNIKMKKSKRAFPELQDQMNKDLISCICHHRKTTEMASEVNSVFSMSLLSQFFASVTVLGLTMFQMTLVPFGSKFLSLIMYQISVMVEIGMFCWFGNEIILKSHQLSSAAYNSEWIDASPQFKNNLRIFMACTRFPVKMYAGNYFTLSLETFVSIMRTSWSYFAVLNNVHNE